MSYLIVLGFVSACLVVIVIAARGGLSRFWSFVLSLCVGGLGIGLGYWLTFVGYPQKRSDGLYQITYPVAGWIGMILGGLIVVVGILASLLVNKKRLEALDRQAMLSEQRKREAEQAKQDAEQLDSAKEAAKAIVLRPSVGGYEGVFGLVTQTLAKHQDDKEAASLFAELQRLAESEKR